MAPERDAASDDGGVVAARDGDGVRMRGRPNLDDGDAKAGVVLAFDADGVGADGELLAICVPAIEIGDEEVQAVEEAEPEIAIPACQDRGRVRVRQVGVDGAAEMGLGGIEDVVDRAATADFGRP